MAWFGVIGFAALAVDCAEGAVNTRQRWRASLFFRIALAIFPWVGTVWAFRLRTAEKVLCGEFLWVTSAILWPVLVLLELFAVFYFCWSLAALAEHELSL